MPAAALRLVLAAAVLSGAAALVYEVVWLRMLGLVVGHAVDALAAVLAAFMAGLAVGAALFGRLAGRLRRPLAACALLEGGIATGSFAPVDVPVITAGILGIGLSVGGWYRPGGRLSPDEIAGEYIPFVPKALDPGLPAPGGARRRRGAATGLPAGAS